MGIIHSRSSMQGCRDCLRPVTANKKVSMLTHVIIIKLKEEASDQAIDLRDSLLALQGQVPSLRQIEAGVDVLGQARSYDVVLIARFDDLDGLEAYQVHPAHQVVGDVIRDVAASIVAVDYVEGTVA